MIITYKVNRYGNSVVVEDISHVCPPEILPFINKRVEIKDLNNNILASYFNATSEEKINTLVPAAPFQDGVYILYVRVERTESMTSTQTIYFLVSEGVKECMFKKIASLNFSDNCTCSCSEKEQKCLTSIVLGLHSVEAQLSCGKYFQADKNIKTLNKICKSKLCC